jgi:hypothetical protein
MDCMEQSEMNQSVDENFNKELLIDCGPVVLLGPLFHIL